MQGIKDIVPKMFYQVHLDNLVPPNNFYRLLDKSLDLSFLYKATKQYYGSEGQESIDPIVFFKICLAGYLNNINSDRKLMEYCSDSLAVRLYLRYDLDEPLPWHSTISRTRQLYGEEVFLSLFRKVLSLCIEKGMVSGDPDARISTKPGKSRNLNYLGQVSVDTSHHVITGAMAAFADKGDSQCLPDIVGQTTQNLLSNGLRISQLLCDKGYSSSEALKYCEENSIDAYIPNFGRYKPEREGFIYNKELDRYECQRGNKAILSFRGIRKDTEYGYENKQYRSSEKNCRHCPLRESCCGNKATYKRLTDTIDKDCYDRMHRKLTENRV